MSSCATPVTTFNIYAIDNATGEKTEPVTETVTASSGCITLYPGFGTASVDGVMTPGEWDNAARYDFAVNLLSSEGGGTTPATLYVMNDGTNLYLAVQVARPALDVEIPPYYRNSGVVFEFENNLDGFWPENGGDALVLNARFANLGDFIDDFRTSATLSCGEHSRSMWLPGP